MSNREDTTMARMIELTDTITGETTTVPVDDVAETLHAWSPDAPTDVMDLIDEFQSALAASAYEARELAVYLAVGFYETHA